MRKQIVIFLISCLSLVTSALFAQLKEIDDTQVRSKAGLTYKPIKGLSIEGSFRHDRVEVFKEKRKNDFSLQVKYDLLPWMHLQTSYKYRDYPRT